MRLLYLQSHLGLLLYLSLSGPALAPPSPVPLRLAGGPGRCAGRVEVLYLHRWGTLCGHTWGLAEAQVVCRQVGCGPALSAPGGAHFGQGEGPVWLDRVTCTGTEGHLGECQVGPWGEASCEHGADVGVVCAGEAGGAWGGAGRGLREVGKGRFTCLDLPVTTPEPRTLPDSPVDPRTLPVTC
ncbi:scavenger receptor cysteine-rich domain-containing group B protein-like [Manacus vitellinus]|uniref:scavenger receptor cysteine-rich domain-containing group B protein-like n=1 Tax=Manacus vitellinus TaxID=328815 RepID=UPI00115DD131|nr:scavenger receptor cysteine-rich domain-containing group B protein-like [Manacus vitellinus]